ncbi:MAG: hypothetical protein WCS30_12005, partial [Selenomonadaceae bacterium]
MTNREKFKANYPNAPLKENGLPEQIQCPYQLGEPYKDKCVRPDDCPGCWGMEECLVTEEKRHNPLCKDLLPNCLCNTCIN